MSKNKLMHPRNIYRTPPDFKQLAIDYPEFRKYAKQELSGKISIDFKDQDTLRALTTCLLEKDFDLKVKIPNDKLVPTLPLRLNYILWIEDVISLFNRPDDQTHIYGIDIGTGACSIYALLCAKKNKWKMLASEIDETSINQARENITNNQLEDLITIKHVNTLEELIDENQIYDFTMCNPPFFSNEEALDSSKNSRNPSRPTPRNAKTGSFSELVVDGGEVSFICQMIKASKEIGTKIRLYSTMVGIKSSLKSLKKELQSINVTNSSVTEFHQGHTTRWGLAWTFDPLVNLSKFSNIQPPQKKNKPFQFTIPLSKLSRDKIIPKIVSIFEELKIKHNKIKESKDKIIYEMEAFENTWTNQRKKRREEKRKLKNVDEIDKTQEENTNNEINDEAPPDAKKLKLEEITDKVIEFKAPSSKKSESQKIYIKTKIEIIFNKTDTTLELYYIEGKEGKDQAHQIMQFIKNKMTQEHQ